MNRTVLTSFVSLAVVGCGPAKTDDQNADARAGAETAVPDTKVTWHRDIRPIAARSCNGCHSEGQIGPFSFDDWSTVSAIAPALVASVEAGTMPPYTFDQDCRETADGLVLTDEEIALFQAWRDDGYEAGDEADYEAPESAARVELPTPDIEIRPIEPLEVDLTRRDEYRCLVTDTVIEEDTWIIGEQALIDNAEIVHHLLYYTVPAEAEEALLALDAESEAPGIPCYEPPGYGFWDLPGLDSWSGWAPGYQTWYQDPASGEPISAVLIKGGSRVVIEGHFNSLATTETAMVDNTGVGLWTLPAGETPDFVLTGAEVADYRLNIPAGAADHVEGGSLELRQSRTVVAVNAHMHMLGTKMEAKVVRADGSEECLTRVDPYDFNWQWSYTLAQPVELQPGDRIDMTCHFDNTAENQPIIDGEPQEPRDVTYGDGTTDEMCIHYLEYSTPYAEWAADR